MSRKTLLSLTLAACAACVPAEGEPETSKSSTPAQSAADPIFETVSHAPTPDWSKPEFAPKSGGPLGTKREATGTPPSQPEAQRIIEKLVEQLNANGQARAYSWSIEPRYMISTRMSEAAFESWAQGKGVEVPDWIEWSFTRELPVPRISDAAAARVRHFPSSARRTGIQRTALGAGQIILRDGCLRVRSSGKAENLAWFAAETGLAVDSAGYLVTIDRTSGSITGRIGEDMVWGGPQGLPLNDPGIAKLRAACGDEEIYNVGNPQSKDRFDKRIR